MKTLRRTDESDGGGILRDYLILLSSCNPYTAGNCPLYLQIHYYLAVEISTKFYKTYLTITFPVTSPCRMI